MSEELELLLVSNDEQGLRLDKFLAQRFRDTYSRTYFQNLIDDELVLVNGRPIKKRAKLSIDDEVEVHFAAMPEIKLTPENIPLSIIYEDEALLIVNKPAGLVIHPAPGNWSGTFVNALLFHCHQLEGITTSLRPGIVHRLDKETSGVLIAAKTLEMQQKLTALFASRQVYKEYLVICLGRPADGKIDAPIGRHPIQRKQMTILPSGKAAVSIFQTLKWNEKLSLVQVIIETGRTHQIRVHMKFQGHPVLGDDLYGNASTNRFFGANRQLLHARRLKFQHPFTGQMLDFEADLPADMLSFIHQMTPKTAN